MRSLILCTILKERILAESHLPIKKLSSQSRKPFNILKLFNNKAGINIKNINSKG